tara:strand:+ start:281 stop:397 length:117 start_codon:yes stop_codon:yes gene_type:complete
VPDTETLEKQGSDRKQKRNTGKKRFEQGRKLEQVFFSD